MVGNRTANLHGGLAYLQALLSAGSVRVDGSELAATRRGGILAALENQLGSEEGRKGREGGNGGRRKVRHAMPRAERQTPLKQPSSTSLQPPAIVQITRTKGLQGADPASTRPHPSSAAAADLDCHHQHSRRRTASPGLSRAGVNELFCSLFSEYTFFLLPFFLLSDRPTWIQRQPGEKPSGRSAIYTLRASAWRLGPSIDGDLENERTAITK